MNIYDELNRHETAILKSEKVENLLLCPACFKKAQKMKHKNFKAEVIPEDDFDPDFCCCACLDNDFGPYYSVSWNDR